MSGIDAYLDPLTGDLPEISRFVTGMDLVRQRILTRLNRSKGEWFLDPEGTGLPHLEWRQTKPPDTNAIGTRVRQEIESVPGVASSTEWKVEHDNQANTVTITCRVYTEDGRSTTLVIAAPTAADRRNVMTWPIFFGGI